MILKYCGNSYLAPSKSWLTLFTIYLTETTWIEEKIVNGQK